MTRAIFYNPSRSCKRDPYAGYVLIDIIVEEGQNGPVLQFTVVPDQTPLPSFTFLRDWRDNTHCRCITSLGVINIRTNDNQEIIRELFSFSDHHQTSVNVYYISPHLWKRILPQPTWKRNFVVANAQELNEKATLFTPVNYIEYGQRDNLENLTTSFATAGHV